MIGVLLVSVVASYLAGSVPIGLLLGRTLRGVDVREYGSGKTGTTNILRTLGKGPAVIALAGDLLKGALPVLIARWLTDDPRIEVVAGMAAIAGHDWPVFAGFRGGRGVATTAGATIAMIPMLGLIIPLIGILILAPWRYMSLMSVLGSIITATLVVAMAATDRADPAFALFAVVAGLLVVLLHKDNIRRLLDGTEPKLGQGGHKRTPTSAPAGGRGHS